MEFVGQIGEIATHFLNDFINDLIFMSERYDNEISLTGNRPAGLDDTLHICVFIGLSHVLLTHLDTSDACL